MRTRHPRQSQSAADKVAIGHRISETEHGMVLLTVQIEIVRNVHMLLQGKGKLILLKLRSGYGTNI